MGKKQNKTGYFSKEKEKKKTDWTQMYLAQLKMLKEREKGKEKEV